MFFLSLLDQTIRLVAIWYKYGRTLVRFYHSTNQSPSSRQLEAPFPLLSNIQLPTMTTTFTVQFFYIPAGKVNAIGHSAFYTERFTILKGTKKEAPWIPRWKSGRNDHSILVKRGTYTYTRNGGENVDIPKVTMRFELEADKVSRPVCLTTLSVTDLREKRTRSGLETRCFRRKMTKHWKVLRPLDIVTSNSDRRRIAPSWRTILTR